MTTLHRRHARQEARSRHGLSVDCLTCKQEAALDIAELVKRFGPDQPCLHCDLIKIIFCHDCRAAGRDDRNLQFTNHAVTPDKRKGWTPFP